MPVSFSMSRVAAVCRASWTRASRTPACFSKARQSVREGKGEPAGLGKTRSQSSQASPGGSSLGVLLTAVLAKLSNEWRGHDEDELGGTAARLDALAAAEVPVAAGALRSFPSPSGCRRLTEQVVLGGPHRR
jgi:hypothetical protein